MILNIPNSWAARARLTTALGAGLLSMTAMAGAQEIAETAVEDVATEDASTLDAQPAAEADLVLDEIAVTAAPGTTTE